MTISIAELHARAGVRDDHSAASSGHGHVTPAGVVEWHNHTPAKDAMNCPYYPQGCVAAGAPRCQCTDAYFAALDACLTNQRSQCHGADTPHTEHCPRDTVGGARTSEREPPIQDTTCAEAPSDSDDTEPTDRPMPAHEYPPVSDDWKSGYRKGMEYCLATLQPLLDAGAGIQAFRDAVRMLHGQMPEPTAT